MVYPKCNKELRNMKTITNNIIKLRKNDERISIKVYTARIQGLNYIYKLIDSKHTKRVYTLTDSTKLYRLLARLYDRQYIEVK